MKKIYFLLLPACFAYISSLSQPVISKQKDIGGKKEDDFGVVALTKDGGIIVGGYSSSDSSYDKSDSLIGFYDYWVVKLDSARNIQWDKTIGGKGYDALKSLQQTRDGGYIL